MRNKPAFTNEQWEEFCDDVRNLFAMTGIPLAGPDGTGKPFIGRFEISFNGLGEDSHETAYVAKKSCEFQFCKTAHKEYDPIVVEFYKLVRKYLPNTKLSSDGGDEVFGGKKIVVNHRWTYLDGGLGAKVGDVVKLSSEFGDVDWEAIVTAVNSDFDGDCKTILGIVSRAPKTVKKKETTPVKQETIKDGIARILSEHQSGYNGITNAEVAGIIVDYITERLNKE